MIFRLKFRLNSVKICVYDVKNPNSVNNWCVPNNVIEEPVISEKPGISKTLHSFPGLEKP
jgi:hypothetical protein